MSHHSRSEFDAAIVGAGPAGLSAAIVLGRSRRRVVVFDHGKPRNFAAKEVHCYLGLDGIAPSLLRQQGRKEARAYGVEFVDAEVVAAKCNAENDGELGCIQLFTSDHEYSAKVVLLATGIVDDLPDIPGLREFYGQSVHHCPYCDGWEHRDQCLAAFGDATSATKLASSLRNWSEQVTACTNGEALSESQRQSLEALGIGHRVERIIRLTGQDGQLAEIHFDSGPPLRCDALFFSADKGQRSSLPEMLGCKKNDKGLMETGKKQATDVCGVYLAGDADGDVQFAIVAAAEGAIAATAMHAALQEHEHRETLRTSKRSSVTHA
jgi:thioredoxin reductase